MWSHMHRVGSVHHARRGVSCQRRCKSQCSKALRYGNDSPLNTLTFTCTHKHTHATTHVHMPLCRKGYERQCHSRPRQAHGSSFQDVLRDVAEGPQWVLKQRGISINKGAITAQLYWKNAQRCVEDFGITITCDLWFMNGVDKFMDVCWSRFLCSSSGSSRCA